MITVKDYFTNVEGDRREKYRLSMSPTIETNASRTVRLVNDLLEEAAKHGITPPINPRTGSQVSSGWRPPVVNSGTPGAAVNSKHMTGLACDIYDPDGVLDDWLTTTEGLDVMERIGLWMEHPASTKGWSHIQIVPPGSGRRVFYP